MHVEPASTLYVPSVGQRTTHAVPPYVPAASITVPPLVVVPTVAVTTEANAPFAAMFVLHVMVVASAATPAVSMIQVRIFLVASIVHVADCAVPLAAALKAHADAVLAAAQITLSAVMTIVFVSTSAVPNVWVKMMLAGTASDSKFDGIIEVAATPTHALDVVSHAHPVPQSDVCTGHSRSLASAVVIVGGMQQHILAAAL